MSDATTASDAAIWRPAGGRLPGSVAQFLLFFGALAVVFQVTGRLQVQLVADSPSYIDYPVHSFDAALRSQRTPGYPILIQVVQRTLGLPAMPLVHLLLLATAAWMLRGELLQWGSTRSRSLAAALAVALGCTAFDNLAIVSTDAPTAALGVLTAASLMRWARNKGSIVSAIPVAILASLAIAFRPAYLFLLPWTFVAGTMLMVLRRRSECVSLVGAAGKASVVVGLALIPVLAWVSLRGFVVGDFGLVPFGQQNLAGVTVQLVTDEELRATEGEPRQLAWEVLRQRDRFLESGGRLAEGDPGATMTYEMRWNDYIWYIVVPAAERLYPGDNLATHGVIGSLNRDIIARFPWRYARWLLLASRRAVWVVVADIVMHPLFLLGGALLIVWEFRRLLVGIDRSPHQVDSGLDALWVVAVTYAALKIGLIIATSPPLGRFADAAAILIPAWIAGRTIVYLGQTSSKATSIGATAVNKA